MLTVFLLCLWIESDLDADTLMKRWARLTTFFILRAVEVGECTSFGEEAPVGGVAIAMSL